MNFLAHLLTSIGDEQVMVGNFIGDFVKGRHLDKYDAKIQTGIRVHRAIDHYTDHHPVVFESKKRLRPNFRHYSPVIVDVFYDHFLAKAWKQYCNEDLYDFTIGFYAMMKKYEGQIPEAVNSMLMHMEAANWLYNYQFLDGIDKALKGMAARTRFESNMEIATEELEKHYSAFENEFKVFFPDLLAFVKKNHER
ncbi:MAG: ACP phosphodiesterase [Bacteroidota bacterium]